LTVEAKVQPNVLGQLPADREHRVQRRHRILEDHADLQARNRAQFAGAQPQEVGTAEGRAPFDDRSRR
jgi:hypothetical protein